MDLNPVFTTATSFRPAGAGGELKLSEQVGIKFIYGWVVDPDGEEAYAVRQTADYDSAVNLIAEADHTTNGHLVLCEDSFGVDGSVPNGHASKTLTEEEREKFTRGTVINSQHELISQCSHPSHHSYHSRYVPQSHLTFHGLLTLASILQPGQLFALFRSSHLSVLYRSKVRFRHCTPLFRTTCFSTNRQWSGNV
jgi:hypothetical protein